MVSYKDKKVYWVRFDTSNVDSATRFSKPTFFSTPNPLPLTVEQHVPVTSTVLGVGMDCLWCGSWVNVSYMLPNQIWNNLLCHLHIYICTNFIL